MPWVQRDKSAAICGVYANRQPGYADEFLADDDHGVVGYLNPPKPQFVLAQDLMAQFTVADFSAIKVGVAANDSFGLLWAALQAQKDPMRVTNARFKTGWLALVSVLGQARMDAIASALGVKL